MRTTDCAHAQDPPALTAVCQHLIEHEENGSRYRRFSGAGRDFAYVCWTCRGR